MQSNPWIIEELTSWVDVNCYRSVYKLNRRPFLSFNLNKLRCSCDVLNKNEKWKKGISEIFHNFSIKDIVLFTCLSKVPDLYWNKTILSDLQRENMKIQGLGWYYPKRKMKVAIPPQALQDFRETKLFERRIIWKQYKKYEK